MSSYDEFDEIVTCKKCKGHSKYGDMIWLNGECMCPDCYRKKVGENERETEEVSE